MGQEFIDIISLHQGIIHKVCGMYLDHEEDRKDLFQEILIQLWKAYPSFQHKSKITTWMYRVALNTAISHFRKQKRKPKNDILSENIQQIADVPYNYELEEKLKILNQAITQLSKIEKAIVMLYLEEHSTEEIGEIVGITANYVRVKMNRIKTKLKKMLNPSMPS